MSRRASLVRQPTQIDDIAQKKQNPISSPRIVARRTSSSASITSLKLTRRLSTAGWVFNQDYWRAAELLNTSRSTKGPIVVVIRHAEALHNVPQATPELQLKLEATVDAPLTQLGFSQAASIQTRYPNLVKAVQAGKRVKVFSSPLLRTLQTTYTAFPFLKPGEVVIAPDLQEGPDWAVSTGSAPHELVTKLNAVFGKEGRTFAANHFSALSLDWYKKTGDYIFDNQAIYKRSRRVRQYIRTLDFDLVVVVTHQGIIPGFCQDRLYQHSDATAWYNAEARAFSFDSVDPTGAAKLHPLSASETASVLGARRPSIARTPTKTVV